MSTRQRSQVSSSRIEGLLPMEASTPSADWAEFLPVGAYCPIDYSECSSEHEFERDIQRRLLETPGLNFSSLVVRRIDDGICVQGVLELSGPHLDLGKVVRDVSGVENVINQVLVRNCPDAVVAAV